MVTWKGMTIMCQLREFDVRSRAIATLEQASA